MLVKKIPSLTVQKKARELLERRFEDACRFTTVEIEHHRRIPENR